MIYLKNINSNDGMQLIKYRYQNFGEEKKQGYPCDS